MRNLESIVEVLWGHETRVVGKIQTWFVVSVREEECIEGTSSDFEYIFLLDLSAHDFWGVSTEEKSVGK